MALLVRIRRAHGVRIPGTGKEASSMSRLLQPSLGIAVVVLLIGGPIVVAVRYEAQMRGFRVVREGVLYRSGQMTIEGLKRIVNDYRIKTLVTLRDTYVPGRPPPDLVEERFCIAEDIRHVRIPPRSWDAPEGVAPADEGVHTFLEVMKDPANYPVLVHCFAGIHRTGAFVAVYRMELEHWSNAQALNEMRAYGYTTLDDEWDILGYLEQYRPSWQPPEKKPPPASRKTKKSGTRRRASGKKLQGKDPNRPHSSAV
jgi:tyrosine-protein phosphatase SIW14